MSTLAARAEDVKFILHSLLVSSPRVITVDELQSDYRLREGRNVPFLELGYPTFMKYLESIPDTVVVCPSSNGGSPVAKLVQSERSAHVVSLVQKQKCHPSKWLSRTRHRAPCRSAVKAIPQMSSTYYRTNYINSYIKHRIFVPVSLQRRIVTMIRENPKGLPVQAIEREFLSSQTLRNYGIHEGCDIHQLLSCLHRLLKISDGMVYPLQDLKVSPDCGSPSDDTCTYTCDITSDIVGKKMKMNFQTLLDKHPNGIWCSELPDLYKKEFAVVLEYANLGFKNMLHMALHWPDVFHCIRPDGTDWKLFDARKKLPPEHAANDIKSNKHVLTKMVPTIASKIRLNLKKLLTYYPSGIPSEQIPRLYKEEFLTTLNVKEMGFDSVEAFLLVLNESVLHLRYVKKEILVYPLAHETEPEKDNPLPHITEARKMEVALVDTTGVDAVHINDVLVNEGLAEYKTNRPSSPLPPQPKRATVMEQIDGDPVSSTITVSRPPPGFTAVSELHNQPLLSPTGSAAPSQSTYVPETPGKSHLQTSVPTLPMANTIPSNFIPQPTDVPLLPVMYDVPLLATASSLAAQSSMLQQFALYETFLQQQQFMRPFALLVSPNIGAASLVNPFMMPVLNPPMMYTQISVPEKTTNVGRSEMGISEIPSTPSPQKNTSGQISPSGTGQLAAAANVSTEDSTSAPATSGTHTETKKLPSVISSGVSHLSVIVNSSPETCTADVQCNEQPTAEAIASPKEVKAMSQVTHAQEQSKDELVHKVLSNTALTEFSSGSYQSDDTVVSHGLESVSDVGFESQYVHEGIKPGTDLSTSSDEIYRSDDEDDDEGGEGVCEQQKQPTLRESKYVKQIEIAGRVIHLIKVMNTVFVCTEEVVRHFTDLSGCHVVLMILDARGIKIPFCEIGCKDSPAIIEDLEDYNVVGVPKSLYGCIIGKVHLTPLMSITPLIPLLNVEYQEEFCSVVESVIW